MGEKHIIEYKRQWDDEWLKWICGLANADGGTMYIGITDATTVWGLQNSKKLMEDIPNKIADKLRLYPGFLRTASMTPSKRYSRTWS